LASDYLRPSRWRKTRTTTYFPLLSWPKKLGSWRNNYYTGNGLGGGLVVAVCVNKGFIFPFRCHPQCGNGIPFFKRQCHENLVVNWHGTPNWKKMEFQKNHDFNLFQCKILLFFNYLIISVVITPSDIHLSIFQSIRFVSWKQFTSSLRGNIFPKNSFQFSSSNSIRCISN